MNPFVLTQSKYGRLVINMHDRYQYQPLVESGIPHIDEEISQILDIVSRLPDGSILVDGGANCGLITLPLALSGKGMVHSFEPQPLIHHCLCAAVILNGLENVRVYQCGLSDVHGDMSLPYIDYHSSNDFGAVRLRPATREGLKVPVAPLDQLIERADFIKLDVETMELQALRGATRIIDQYRPWCWVEYLRSDISALTAFFRAKGYRMYRVDHANMVASPNDTRLDFMTHMID